MPYRSLTLPCATSRPQDPPCCGRQVSPPRSRSSSLSRSAVAADDGCLRRYRWDVAAVGEVSHERLERRHDPQRIGVGDVVLDPHVDEAHAVLEPKDFVGEAVQLTLVQLGEHRLDELLILLGPLRLGLITQNGRRHRRLPVTRCCMAMIIPSLSICRAVTRGKLTPRRRSKRHIFSRDSLWLAYMPLARPPPAAARRRTAEAMPGDESTR